MERLTLAQIRERFGRSNERRQELFARFEEWLAFARGTGSLQRVWIVGSWVTQKAIPADIDVVALFSAGFEPVDLPFEVRS